jgi:hypothetical protein
MDTPEIIAVYQAGNELHLNFAQSPWDRAQILAITREWSGEAAPEELRTTARALWSERGLLLGFECGFTELDVDEEFDPLVERNGLWDRDVCEAFIRSPLEPSEKHYREFEVAPTGQFCDLLIDRSRMWSDWEWKSGMRTAHEISTSEKIWRVAMEIPFEAFGRRPEPGEVWQGNLFRISRFEGERRYLALSPTLTESPSYHVPERFINLRFVL